MTKKIVPEENEIDQLARQAMVGAVLIVVLAAFCVGFLCGILL